MRYTPDILSREARRRAPGARALLALTVPALALSLSACSFAIPSLVPDQQEATGSIDRVPVAGRDLGHEDNRRAHGALATALDPQGAGDAVNWDNPGSKVRGTIVPIGQPYVRESEICRDFKAVLVRTGRSTTRDGTACRISTGDWAVQYIGFPRRTL